MKGKAQRLGFIYQHGAIGGIEATEYEHGARSHLRTELWHIGQEDVAVDIGQNEVERSFHLI